MHLYLKDALEEGDMSFRDGMEEGRGEGGRIEEEESKEERERERERMGVGGGGGNGGQERSKRIVIKH